MSQRLSLGAFGALASLCLASSAWAGAVEDFKKGKDVQLTAVSAVMDGEIYSIAGFQIPKAADTLNITLTGADLGLNFSQSVFLTGVQSGNSILWTFNQTFNPPIAVDGTTVVNHVSGLLIVNATLLAGTHHPLCGFQPCLRDVLLTHAPGSWILVEGEGALGIDFSRLVMVDYFRALGGIPQPGLSAFYVPGTAKVCSSPVTTYLPMTAFLTGFAPSGGTKVDFVSAYPKGLKVPPNLTVPGGQSTASFKAAVAPDFTGQVNVVASSAGAIYSRLVQIFPQADCDSGGNRNDPFDVRAYVPDLLLGCINCSELIDLGIRGQGLLRVQGLDVYFNGSQLRRLSSVFDVVSVSAVDMTDSGLVTGSMVVRAGEAPVAFRASLEGGPTTPIVLGAFTPTAITASGVVIGNHTSRTSSVAMYHDGRSLKELPIPGATRSQALAVSEAGHIVGTYERDGDVRAFLFTEGVFRTLPQLSRATTTVPVAVNNRGQVVAHSVDATGAVLAVAIIEPNDTFHLLGVPSGFTGLTATSINARGWVSATATSHTGTSGFLYTREDGWVDLNRRLSPAGSVVVTDALRITDADQVLVHGTANGNRALYLLTLP
ncbi:hypothetical protein [Corallococcus llansteffanensis]|uniref:Uncharacterized protein n=1 Tax=Corallococcus llansteffanensis TaxID=2316731 RepID=A0A3A8PI01_9BACT|nr:hypothetical protein [Corallococcus llansteffanensis]RKH54940.1 hypothetical protein D7V93_24260 [Corallococcus llansteffanensis]